jgi:hypothetical protein
VTHFHDAGELFFARPFPLGTAIGMIRADTPWDT